MAASICTCICKHAMSNVLTSTPKNLSLGIVPQRFMYGKKDLTGNFVEEQLVDKHRRHRLADHPTIKDVDNLDPNSTARDLKNVYPDFLPDPIWKHRDKVRELLEREDMHRRRAKFDIPEFYVGSILAVTIADKYGPGKKNRFNGICIQRCGQGLRTNFVLRNIIDGLGVEIRYNVYSPFIHKIELLKLEKRLDDDLLYLRDAPPEYSTIPEDMKPVLLPKGSSLPINPLMVPLNPLPWFAKHHLKEYKGAIIPELGYKRKKRVEAFKKPYLKYDIMKHYRESIDELETEQIMKEVTDRKTATEQEKKPTISRKIRTRKISRA